MVSEYFLPDLPPGLYHLRRGGDDLVELLTRDLERSGHSCMVFPPVLVDYLVADTVLREAAFDLENLGFSGKSLQSRVESIIRESLFVAHPDQEPLTLSGGEQQLLAITAALQQPHEFMIGRNCFDFVSEGNLNAMREQVVAGGKRLLDISYRNGQPAWRYDAGRIVPTDSPPAATHTLNWTAIPSWKLAASGLEKSHPGNFALRISSMDKNQLHCLGVYGENGSGKSTLADCLAGMTTYAGHLEARIDGSPARQIGYLLQQAAAASYDQALEDLLQRFVSRGKLTPAKKAKLDASLNQMPAYRTLAAQDAGTGYRLAIAAALLMGDYDLVILDEPCYGLPAQAAAEFLADVTHTLGACPLVLISHDRNFLEGLCDSMIALDHGVVYDPAG